MNYFDGYLQENAQFIKHKFENNIRLINDVFEIEIELFKLISGTLEPNLHATNNTTPIALSGCYKSLLSIYNAFRLTIDGYYGSARILLRHAFEYLLIAKYCSINRNNALIEKWERGDDISLGREVLSKLASPLPSRFRTFWKLLCQFTHATVYSQQAELEATKNEKDIGVNFQLIKALLEMNYHLFNRHFVNNSIKFYFDYYAKESDNEMYRSLKLEIRHLFSNSKENMSNETKGIIKDYVSTWKLKS